MAWYWPTIEDESSAEHATKAAVGVSGFIAAITALLETWIVALVYDIARALALISRSGHSVRRR